ncbi:MAG: tRNA lysidine(34) synthetase TilS [Actinomycetales bacterium]|nr:tRNA lysidine(34) synthetase TilS [Actinomycetales bacterium]
MTERPRLTPAMADVRRAVRDNWDAAIAAGQLAAGDLVLVGCSGGADSMALAEAAAFEGERAGMRVGAIVVDHGLQAGSDAVAAQTAEVLSARGLAPVLVRRVQVGRAGGTEAAARDARYGAFAQAAADTGARAVALAHSLNDQAETVLLGLARGSGAKSLAGMRDITAAADFVYLRPLLAITRETTVAACVGAGIEYWQDPMNDDPDFARVRARKNVLPVLEAELGPGIAAALARTADIAREDSDYLDTLSAEILKAFAKFGPTSITLPVDLLEQQPAAIRNRVIAQAIAVFGTPTTRAHVLAVAELATDWHGQKPLTLPGIRVGRTGGEIHLKSAKTLTPGAC